MSTMDNDPSRPGVKTLAIRLNPELHTQLFLVAQLRGNSITAEIRTAIETHIQSVKTAPELVNKAETVLADIERDALARREAIAILFGTGDVPSEAEPDSSASGAAATPISARTKRRTGGNA